MNEHFDLASSDAVLTYGDGAATAYRMHAGPDRSPEVAVVGSPDLEGVGRAQEDTPPSPAGPILYITTNYYQNGWYYGYKPTVLDRLLYQSQMSLLETLEKLNSRQPAAPEVLLRLYPGREDIYPWAGRFAGLPGFSVAPGKSSLRELLKQCRAVIVDFPTTTLLQTVATTLPVFVLMKFWHFDPEARAKLARRAVVADDDATLARAIEAYILEDSYPADCHDREFMRDWGVHRDDGRSCQRAMEVLARYCLPDSPPRVNQEYKSVQTHD